MLLYTFLGRVTSQAGREFERVLAVAITAEGEPRSYHKTGDWLSLADPTRAIRTTDIWKHHFAGWAGSAHECARGAAATEFDSLAKSFAEARHQTLAAERDALQQWLEQRVQDLAGDVQPSPRQRDLFDQVALSELAAEPSVPTWTQLTDPAERLAAFGADASRPPARRSEADSVLRIHRQRQEELEARLTLGAPEIVPLGVLMLVPENHHGA
jgi:hypothetical protein